MSKEILFATRNLTKFSFIKNLVSSLDVRLISLLDFPELPKIPEEGESLQEIAENKAMRAFSVLDIPSFAIDTGLTIPALSDSQQPGMYVRRFQKDRKERKDDEILKHYQSLFQSLDGEIVGVWTSAIAFVDGTENIDSSSYSSQTLFVAEASPHISPGEPLNSFQYDTALNKYVSEMDGQERIISMGERAQGLLSFIRSHI